MLRVTFDDGSVQELDPNEVIEVASIPPSATPKPGWERTQDYPPEYRKFTNLRAGVLVKGSRVPRHNGIRVVVSVERV